MPANQLTKFLITILYGFICGMLVMFYLLGIS
jgi:hypothetical protein